MENLHGYNGDAAPDSGLTDEWRSEYADGVPDPSLLETRDKAHGDGAPDSELLENPDASAPHSDVVDRDAVDAARRRVLEIYASKPHEQ